MLEYVKLSHPDMLKIQEAKEAIRKTNSPSLKRDLAKFIKRKERELRGKNGHNV